MTQTPIYADTVRATGIVLDPYEPQGERDGLGGVAVVEFPSIAPGVVYYSSLMPAFSRSAETPYSAADERVLIQRTSQTLSLAEPRPPLPQRYPSRRL